MEVLQILLVLLVLGTHRVLWTALDRWSHAPSRVYRSPCIVAAALRHWRFPLLLVLPLLPAAFWPAETSWHVFEVLPGFRVLVTVMAAGLAWTYATNHRNLYFDRDFLVDRLLVLVLVGAVWAHPAFAGPLLVVISLLARQLDHPGCLWNSWTDILLPMAPLTLLASSMPWLPAGLTPVTVAVLLFSCIGAHYVVTGLAKLRVGPYSGSWLVRDRPSLLLVTCRNYGWLANIPMPRVIAWSRLLARVDIVLALYTLVIELGFVALLAGRPLAITLFMGAAGLHLGIFVCSGIFFWKWALTAGAAAVFLAVLPGEAAATLFTPAHFALSLLIITLSPLVFGVAWLGWEDTRFNNFFCFEAIGRSGHTYQVSRHWFSPHEVAFSQSRFFFLYDGPVLVGTHGCHARRDPATRRLADELEASAGDPDRLEDIKRRMGRNTYDPAKAKAFAGFLARVFERHNAGVRRHSPLPIPPAPMHMMMWAERNAYRRQEQVDRVIVRYVETFFDGNEVRRVLDRVVLDVPVPAPEASVTSEPARRVA